MIKMEAKKKMKEEKETLTAEDLKGSIFKSLQASGVYDELKKNLRQKMVNELQTKNSIAGKKVNGGKSNLLSATIHPKADVCWTQKALDNVILHHIKRSKYHYTLSLFQQESGLKKYSKTLTIELITKLGLKPINFESKSFNSSADSSVISYSSLSTTESSDTPSKWMLWDIMEALANYHNSEACKQLSETNSLKKSLTLADKLLAVDEEYTKHCETLKSTNKAVTSLNAAVQQAEREADRRYRQQLEQWKMYELTKMRAEEAEKASKMIKERIKQLEKDYGEQKKALETREKMAVERLTNHKKSLEAENHLQRQKLLQEMSGLKSREELIEQQEKHIRKMENMRIKELDMLREATLNGKHLATADDGTSIEFRASMNEVLMAQLDQLSKENAKLKTELSQIKMYYKPTGRDPDASASDTLSSAVNPSPKRNRLMREASKENERLKTRIDELENAISDLKTEKQKRDEEVARSESDEKLREQVKELRQTREEQAIRHRQMEDMIRKLRDAIEQNSKEAKKNVGLPHKYLSASPRQLQAITKWVSTENNNYNEGCDSSLRKNDAQIGDDYEQVCKDLLMGYVCHDQHPASRPLADPEQRSMFKTCCSKERVRILGEQSDELQREYEKYAATDFERKLSETKLKFFTKPADEKNHFQVKGATGMAEGGRSGDDLLLQTLAQPSDISPKPTDIGDIKQRLTTRKENLSVKSSDSERKGSGEDKFKQIVQRFDLNQQSEPSRQSAVVEDASDDNSASYHSTKSDLSKAADRSIKKEKKDKPPEALDLSIVSDSLKSVENKSLNLSQRSMDEVKPPTSISDRLSPPAARCTPPLARSQTASPIVDLMMPSAHVTPHDQSPVLPSKPESPLSLSAKSPPPSPLAAADKQPSNAASPHVQTPLGESRENSEHSSASSKTPFSPPATATNENHVIKSSMSSSVDEVTFSTNQDDSDSAPRLDIKDLNGGDKSAVKNSSEVDDEKLLSSKAERHTDDLSASSSKVSTTSSPLSLSESKKKPAARRMISMSSESSSGDNLSFESNNRSKAESLNDSW